MIITATFFIVAACIAESAILDPALYLVPSPPLVPASGSVSPGEMWGRSLRENIARDLQEEDKKESTQKPAAVESRMFWPRFSSPEPVVGVRIPLTFSLSGSYGKVASLPGSIIANSYTSLTGLGTSMSSDAGSSSILPGKSGVASIYGNYGRSALAGSSYGSFGSGVRVFGGDNVAAWSGWGNGKWGHYGKG